MTTNYRDRRKYFPEDIWVSLTYYANEEKIGKSPEVQALITPDGMAWEMLRNGLRKAGHYPPKTGEKKQPGPAGYLGEE